LHDPLLVPWRRVCAQIHNELNVFDGVFKNAFFLVIVIGTLVVQIALIETKGACLQPPRLVL